MTDQMRTCKIDTGDYITSSLRGPHWTPYAEAIAAYYPIQIPWYTTRNLTIGATSLVLPRVVVTRPQQYDVLILGMSATQSPDPSTSGTLYMNVTDTETQIPWVAPNSLGFAPLPAFAGLNLNVTSTLKLPEAFFLPARTQLRIDYVPFAMNISNLSIILTLIGVQLINPSQGFQAPRWVTMPNGDQIPVGSRMPWFGCVPFGAKANTAGSRVFGDYVLNAKQQTVQYLPPSDCNVEIHDAYASFLDTTREYTGNPILLKTKIDDTKTRDDWTPMFAPVQAAYGSFVEVNPTMPFVKPQLIETDHKILMVAQNNSVAVPDAVTKGTVTFRGVRLCQY